MNSGIHLGRLIKQKIPIRCQQPHSTTLPGPSSLSGRNGAEETPVTIHRPSNSSGVAPLSGLDDSRAQMGFPAPPLPSSRASLELRPRLPQHLFLADSSQPSVLLPVSTLPSPTHNAPQWTLAGHRTARHRPPAPLAQTLSSPAQSSALTATEGTRRGSAQGSPGPRPLGARARVRVPAGGARGEGSG